ncbi:MAG: hypothetical protein IPJ61_20275 [Tessaracoccus sp.]|uniref:hypothetical protein n=1 Tax=Tessaracoccus sp. TaxID=1971211 RepID=UPI001ECEF518|nr:hypothetical protein [Tessaracoccus sp.]MBK7823325.1 hypothetical protein [Tessaracoccus sp.]
MNTADSRQPPAEKRAYTDVERPGRGFVSVCIGIATVHNDGSITIRLDALPVNGILTVK